VILIALAKVVLGTYVPLMLAAMDGRRWAGILGALEGVLLLCGVGFASLLGQTALIFTTLGIAVLTVVLPASRWSQPLSASRPSVRGRC
jgi:hypothetical protein